MQSALVVGVDGWSKGWVAVSLVDGVFAGATHHPVLSDLLQPLARAVAVAVDMPIGFADAEPRRADVDVRRALGPRRSSVFPTLPQAVYEAETYAEAIQICRAMWGKAFSKQAFSLRDKIFEVADLTRTDDRIFEVHPEMSFAAMAGAPLAWSKRTWNGQAVRRRLLASVGIDLPDDLEATGVVPVDDVLDAAACAWSAERMRVGTIEVLPRDPHRGEPTIRF